MFRISLEFLELQISKRLPTTQNTQKKLHIQIIVLVSWVAGLSDISSTVEHWPRRGLSVAYIIIYFYPLVWK